MRVSRLFKQDSSPDGEGVPTNKLGLWLLLFVAVIVGLVLYFIFGRGVPSVL